MKVKFNYFLSLDTDRVKIMIATLLISVLVETIDDIPFLSIYIFKKRVYHKRYILKRRRNTIFDMLHIVKYANLHTKVKYGFNNPCTTGLVFGALSSLSNVDQNPDFLPQYEYVVIDGIAQLYLWTTMMNYIKNRRKVAI